RLQFRQPARTSRSVLHDRLVYFLIIRQYTEGREVQGWGEIAPLDGLSPEGPEFHQAIQDLAQGSATPQTWDYLTTFPSFRFGLEAARLDLRQGGRHIWHDSPFIREGSTIPIN